MKFQVGDRVKVIKSGSHGQYIGDTGYIKNIDNSYFVKMDKDGDCWYFRDDEIELIKNVLSKYEEEEIEEIEEKIKPGKIKSGGIIREPIIFGEPIINYYNRISL